MSETQIRVYLRVQLHVAFAFLRSVSLWLLTSSWEALLMTTTTMTMMIQEVSTSPTELSSTISEGLFLLSTSRR